MAVFTDTVADMIQEFGYLVGEPNINNTRWGRDARLRFLNMAQLDAVTMTRCLENTFDSAVSAWVNDGDEKVTFGAKFYNDGILEIYWLDANGDYHPLAEFHPRFQTIQNDTIGQPNEFYRVGNNFYLMPKPEADGTVVIIAQQLPNELVNDSDTSLIPEAYRTICVLGAVKRAFREDDEYGKGDRTEVEYASILKELKKYSRRMRSKRKTQMIMPQNLFTRGRYYP
jgi:hypothetical protein